MSNDISECLLSRFAMHFSPLELVQVHLLICVVLVLPFWKLLDCEDAPFVIRAQLGKDSQAVSYNGNCLQLWNSIDLSEKCALKSYKCCMPRWSSILLLAAMESDKLRENTGTADPNPHVRSSLWVNSYMISQQELWKSIGSRQSCMLQSDECCVFHPNFRRTESSQEEKGIWTSPKILDNYNEQQNNSHCNVSDSNSEVQSQTWFHTEQHGKFTPLEDSVKDNGYEGDLPGNEQEEMVVAEQVNSKSELRSHTRLHIEWPGQLGPPEGRMNINGHDLQEDEQKGMDRARQIDNQNDSLSQTRLYIVWLGQLTPQEDGVEENGHKRDQQEDKQKGMVGKNEPQSHTRIRHCTDWQRLLAGSMEGNGHDGDQQEHRTFCDNTKTFRLQNFYTFFDGGCLHHEDM